MPTRATSRIVPDSQAVPASMTSQRQSRRFSLDNLCVNLVQTRTGASSLTTGFGATLHLWLVKRLNGAALQRHRASFGGTIDRTDNHIFCVPLERMSDTHLQYALVSVDRDAGWGEPDAPLRRGFVYDERHEAARPCAFPDILQQTASAKGFRLHTFTLMISPASPNTSVFSGPCAIGWLYFFLATAHARCDKPGFPQATILVKADELVLLVELRHPIYLDNLPRAHALAYWTMLRREQALHGSSVGGARTFWRYDFFFFATVFRIKYWVMILAWPRISASPHGASDRRRSFRYSTRNAWLLSDADALYPVDRAIFLPSTQDDSGFLTVNSAIRTERRADDLDALVHQDSILGAPSHQAVREARSRRETSRRSKGADDPSKTGAGRKLREPLRSMFFAGCLPRCRWPATIISSETISTQKTRVLQHLAGPCCLGPGPAVMAVSLPLHPIFDVVQSKYMQEVVYREQISDAINVNVTLNSGSSALADRAPDVLGILRSSDPTNWMTGS
ncbi:hypothetical protein DENSPDRAFT_851219 [Dentipellis sp. KUC8613]|nr:hypothetical protein DENSPDRAFT_851219 [Dentipellis sp. KUC8613]